MCNGDVKYSHCKNLEAVKKFLRPRRSQQQLPSQPAAAPVAASSSPGRSQQQSRRSRRQSRRSQQQPHHSQQQLSRSQQQPLSSQPAPAQLYLTMPARMSADAAAQLVTAAALVCGWALLGAALRLLLSLLWPLAGALLAVAILAPDAARWLLTDVLPRHLDMAVRLSRMAVRAIAVVGAALGEAAEVAAGRRQPEDEELEHN